MIIAGARVSRVADITDNFTLPRVLADCQAIGIALKMSVIKDEFLVRAELIDGRSTAFALKEPHNFTVARRHNRSSRDRKSTRLNSSHGYISYAVFCLKKKT